jgi:hypothetical protein
MVCALSCSEVTRPFCSCLLTQLRFVVIYFFVVFVAVCAPGMYVCICVCVCVCACVYKGVGQKSGPCTATFNDLLCFPF